MSQCDALREIIGERLTRDKVVVEMILLADSGEEEGDSELLHNKSPINLGDIPLGGWKTW